MKVKVTANYNNDTMGFFVEPAGDKFVCKTKTVERVLNTLLNGNQDIVELSLPDGSPLKLTGPGELQRA